MKLEDQVCGSEFAKRLKELGVKQESLFYWNTWDADKQKWDIQTKPKQRPDYYISAFTVGELVEMLPDYVSINPAFDRSQQKRGWYCKDMRKKNESTFSYNQACAYAKMLIHILENKIIT